MIRLITAAVLASTGYSAYGAEAPAGSASCSGCHPATKSVATPVPRLNTGDAAQIVTAMRDFRSGRRPATVMDRLAKGFTDEEIDAISAWYAAQKD